MPTQWYNILADLPKPFPPYHHPATLQPLGPDDLAPIFPMALIMQEVSTERYIDIPEEVQDIYKLWRPSPLYRAHRLEKHLQTPAKIYYKYEGVSPVGSHKPNTAIAQAYYNKKEGVRRLTTETGAGQWGSAISMASRFFGLECTVYMVKVSYQQKPYRRVIMETYGAEVFASPTDQTNSGRKILEMDPNSPGSLGIAISEAVEDAATHDDAKYSLGSVVNFVLMHQTVIGQEAKKQLAKVDDYPDVIIGCCGGGSNFAGLSYPFLYDKLRGDKPNLRAIAVEPEACPSLTRGKYAYDFGDSVGLGPVSKMYTLGHGFVPSGIHAGGLRYHGDAPSLCLLYDEGIVEARAYHQIPVFEAAKLWAGTEGIVPAPESAHALKATIDEALRCREAGRSEVIMACFSGHGLFDLGAYDEYNRGKLQDFEYRQEDIDNALKDLPAVKA
ncbi:MAG: TrpB-like pyridoxal phosphate-dependent enzyme [Chloroflexi bacterium]|nr:TrpB-like pyridoxal phosphate-dependent enzyme [Chloroflexota bacterium]